MKKVLRYAGFAVAGLLALLLVLLGLARFLVSSEQVRDVVLPMAKDALHREVTLGDVEISLFSGIVLHDLTVMNKAGDAPFVEAGSVVLRYRFWPLLRLKVVVDEVRLEQPVLRVVRLADGRFNFSDLLETKQSATADEGQSSEASGKRRALNLLVSEVLLNGGMVRFVDYRPDPDRPFSLDLSDLDLRAANISMSQPFPIEAGVSIHQARLEINGQVDPSSGGGRLNLQLADLNLPDFAPYYQKGAADRIQALKINCDVDLEGNARQLRSSGKIMLDGLHLASGSSSRPIVSDLDISLDYAMQLDRDAATLLLERGRLVMGGLPVDLQGRLENIDKRPVINGSATITRLDLASLPKILPTAVPENLSAMKPSGFVHARLQLEGPLEQPKTLLKSGEVRLDEVAVTAGSLRPEVTGTLTLAKDVLEGKGIKVLLGQDRALLDLKAQNLLSKPIRIDSAVSADRLQIDALLGNKAKSGEKNGAGIDAAGKTVKKSLGPYDLPVIAAGTLLVKQAVWRGLLIEDLSARYQLKNNIFTLDQFAGKTAGGTFSETARIDLTQPGLAYSTHIETAAIQADPMLSALAPKMSGTVFGLLNLSVDMQGRGTGLEDLKQNLSGSGALKIADGKITGAGLVAGLAEFFDLEELRVLRFSQAAGKLAVKDGRVQVDGSLMGNDVRLTPTGSVGLDGSLDLGLPVRLSPELTSRLDSRNRFSRFLSDSRGWGELPLKLTGTWKAPRFALDTEALGSTVRRGVQQQLQKTLQEKLFKTKDEANGSPETGETQQQGTTDANGTQEKSSEEKLLEGVMKGLFGK